MDDDNVIEEIETEHGTFRVRLEVDEDASELNPRTWGDNQVGVMACVKSFRYAVPQEDAATVNHWTLEDAVLDHGFQVVARWLRMFHGATVVLPLCDERGTVVGEAGDQHDAEDYFGVIFDTPQLRERMGLPVHAAQVAEVLAAEVREYGAWADGEVYGCMVERRRCSGGPWEDVDACYGLVGDDYAEQEARRMLAEAVEAVKAEHAREMATCGSCGRTWCDKCTPTHGPRCPFEDEGEVQHPMLEVEGVTAFLYLHEDGAMRVSLHFDDVDTEARPRWAWAVPLKVDVGGVIVYEIDEQGRETVRPGSTATLDFDRVAQAGGPR